MYLNSYCGVARHFHFFYCVVRKELENHVSTSTLSKLLVSYSRDIQPEGTPRYVQHNIVLHGEQLVELLEQQGAVVYVCGDAKNMARDVNEAFIEIFAKHKGKMFVKLCFFLRCS